MGRPRSPLPVKLVVGLLSGDSDLLRRARQLLVKRFGELDLEGEILPFQQTQYYEAEMGPDLLRQFVAFEALIRPEALAEIKLETNALEQQLSEQCAALGIARPVNIDPGYVDLGKLALATTKDRSHRLHLGHGIFAEVTLHWVDGAWRDWPWTYPDYREPAYHAFFAQARARLMQQRKMGHDAGHASPRERSGHDENAV